MKQNLTWLLLFIIYLSVYPQDQKYRIVPLLEPQSVYITTTELNNEIVMDYPGNKKMAEQLKQKGIVLLLKSQINQFITHESRTGEMLPDNSFPIDVTVKDYNSEMTIAGVKTQVPVNDQLKSTKVKGIVVNRNKITNLHIESSAITDELKSTMISSIENMLNNIRYPDSMIAVGESFSMKIPFNLPIGKNSFAMEMVIKYTLEKVEEQKAYFSNIVSLEFNTKTEDFFMTAEGSGTGSVVHDLVKRFDMEVNMEMSVSAKIDAGGTTMIINSKTKQKQAVSKI